MKHISSFYLSSLFIGTLFFIPAIFVNRFITAPGFLMQAGVSIGVLVFFIRKRYVFFPNLGFLLLMGISFLYLLWRCKGDFESCMSVITLFSAFFLFYNIWIELQDIKTLFYLFTLLAVMLSLWGLGQYVGWISSYHGLFTITGPFDNPAGISASLALLLPFPLYLCLQKKYRMIMIIIICLIATIILLSQARAAVLATVFIFISFFLHLLKKRNIKPLPVHYAALSIGCLLLFGALFYQKKDSANGRLLIWQCSVRLIANKPVFGYGGNGFTANYMNEQANYFTKNPDSKFAMLADNVRHPFNEFLKWIVNYGIVGLCMMLLLIVILLWISWKNNSSEHFFVRLSLFAISICAIFSYPFNYPFIRLMLISLLSFIATEHLQKSIKLRNGYLSKAIAVAFSIALLSTTAYQTFYEYDWHKIAHKSLRGEILQMLPRYKSVYTFFHHKDLFLYNYAAELNAAGHHMESLLIARECESLLADYDLQMLMADNCLQLKLYSEAESYLNKAAAMCPVKFMPLYRMVEYFLETGRKEEARVLAQKILYKNEKVHSPLINIIKTKMRTFLSEFENLNK